MGEIDRVRSKERMSDISPCIVFPDQVNDYCQIQKVIEENFIRLKDQLMVCLRMAGKEDFLAPQIALRPDLRQASLAEKFHQWTTHNQKTLEQLIQHLFSQFCHSCRCTSGQYPIIASQERMSDISPCTFLYDQSTLLDSQMRIEENFGRLRSQLLVCLRKAGKEDFLLPQITKRPDFNAIINDFTFNHYVTVNQQVLEKLIQNVFSQMSSSCRCALRSNEEMKQ